MTDKKIEERMIADRLLHGQWRPGKIGKPLSYFETRRVFLDCRGPLRIDPSSEWGWFVMVLTQSHDVSNGEYTNPVVQRGVTVDEHAWIGSRALLYNCHVKHHAIVACGAVVRNMTVEPYTVVQGNPARAYKRFVEGEWVKEIERLSNGNG